ncbi:phage protease [Mameliella alba]|uniref:phage protease n=1 Tax=Mameliella alba TaxID=561184 RepID=UPI001C93AC60|nr:phage protease [Mameliella alba]MBY6118536.1 phage protease [Mameliella alba]
MNTRPDISSFEAVALSLEGEAPPDWIQLLPAPGKKFRSIDGRGPWFYDSAEELIAASTASGERIFIDVNHATTRSAPKGGDAPAVGWIEELQGRPDGIWGRVTWNSKGAELMADRAYHGISPVMSFNKATGKVARIFHASLTNTPALGGAIASLSEETDDMSMAAIAKALGLADDAGEDATLAAISKLKEGAEKPAELATLALALGAEEGASVAELTVLAKAAVANAGDADQVAELTQQLGDLRAERWLDQKVAEGRAIDAELRAELSALWIDNPERAEKLVSRLPKLSRTHTANPAPKGEAITELSADQKVVADQLGMTHEDFLAQLKADAGEEEAA